MTDQKSRASHNSSSPIKPELENVQRPRTSTSNSQTQASTSQRRPKAEHIHSPYLQDLVALQEVPAAPKLRRHHSLHPYQYHRLSLLHPRRPLLRLKHSRQRHQLQPYPLQQSARANASKVKFNAQPLAPWSASTPSTSVSVISRVAPFPRRSRQAHTVSTDRS